MNNFELAISLIGGVVASAFGWFMKMLFNRQQRLEDRLDRHEKQVLSDFKHLELQIAELRRDITENSLRDKLNQEKILLLLETHGKILDNIEMKIKEYDKNISNFYQINPNVKNPEIKK